MNNRTSIEISESLRQFIEALVEEVALDGKPFDAQKKWLRMYCEAEGLNYETLESNLNDLFEALDGWKKQKSKTSQLAVRMLAKKLYLSENMVEKLVDERTPQPLPEPTLATEFVDPQFLMRDGQLEEVEIDGRLITPCEWRSALGFHEGLAMVTNEDGLNGYVDPLGNNIIPFQWRVADSFSEGLALVSNEKGENFFIDRAGSVMITCEPDVNPIVRCCGFHEGLTLVEKNRKYGFMDKLGRMVVPFTWSDANWFEDGLAAVWNEQGKCGCIDKMGRMVIPCQYDDEIVFYEGLATIYNDGDSFIIDKTGRKVFDLECGCDHVCFQEGLGSIEYTGFIDKSGAYVIERFYSPEFMGFTEGLAPTAEGYIDHSGRIVIPDDQWEECLEFRESLAVVVKNQKCGYIDHSGRLVIPYIWDSACSFSEGLAKVELADKYYFINKQGQVLCKVKRLL